LEQEAKQEEAYKELVRDMAQIIHADKIDRVLKHMIYPLPVTAITGEILRDINRVFEGRNKHFSVNSDSQSQQKNIDDYLSKVNAKAFIEKYGRIVLKNKPNSVIVLDRNEEKGAYPILVDNDRILDFDIDHDGKFQYISFLHSEHSEKGVKTKYIAFYDAYKYRVFKSIGGNITATPEIEVSHNLGYCPARSFMTEDANSKTKFRKKTPLLTVLGSLLHWTTYDAGKRYIDNYVPYPIIEKAISACNNEDCNGGFIYRDAETSVYNANTGETAITVNTSKTACPTCAKSSLLGPGTTVNIDPTDNKEDLDARGIFKFIIPDTSSLEYIQNILDQIELKSHLKATGMDGMITKEAVNSDQVKGSFERAKSVLLGIKVQLELAYLWMLEGLIKLQFGIDGVSINANFGTEWYILTEEHLQNLFGSAKEMGLPESEIDEIYSMLVETKYRSNPMLVDRLKTINELSPAPYDTTEEAIRKKEQGGLSNEDLIIKLNLTRYIKRFERENGSIAGYGAKETYLKKVNSIYQRLKDYANEQRNEAE